MNPRGKLEASERKCMGYKLPRRIVPEKRMSREKAGKRQKKEKSMNHFILSKRVTFC